MAGIMPGKDSKPSPSLFHDAELQLCVSHASALASAVGASLSRGCVFATLYVSQEAAESAVASGLGVKRKGGRSSWRGEMHWLQCMVEECRRLIEETEAAGREDEGKGDGDDSAEEGWTSDPEELAKEAARKMVLSRRLPILPVVVPSLPKNSAVELEVLCMSRAALSLLPCKYYPPSTRFETLTRPPAGGNSCSVPALYASLLQASERSGGDRYREKPRVFSATTSGSTVNGILCVLGSSVSVHADASRHSAGKVSDGNFDNDIHSDKRGSTAACEESCATEIPALGDVVFSGARLERALILALEGISEAISSARLKWRDVSHLRVYYRGQVVRPHGWSSSGEAGDRDRQGYDVEGCSDEEELLKRAMHLALASTTPERPAITFVPVNALEAVGDIVNIHTTAWNVGRLRTELWVRGAP